MFQQGMLKNGTIPHGVQLHRIINEKTFFLPSFLHGYTVDILKS